MKNFLAFLILTTSVSAIAQERVMMNSKSVEARGSSAELVRTARTPNVVTVTFNVPMANTYCAEPRTEVVPQTCFRHQNDYRTREVCRDVVTTSVATPSTTPRGPRYNNPGSSTSPVTTTRRLCSTENVLVRSYQIPYDCSFVRNVCDRYATNISTQPDSVKFKFKNIPSLGGSEEETFLVSARQRMTDGANVEYDIKALSTLNGREYEIKKKGLFGADSYVIQPK